MPSNVPGSLHKALSVFSWRGINLSKIESSTVENKARRVLLLMDLVKDQPEKLIEAALTELELIGAEIKILGITRSMFCPHFKELKMKMKLTY